MTGNGLGTCGGGGWTLFMKTDGTKVYLFSANDRRVDQDCRLVFFRRSPKCSFFIERSLTIKILSSKDVGQIKGQFLHKYNTRRSGSRL